MTATGITCYRALSAGEGLCDCPAQLHRHRRSAAGDDIGVPLRRNLPAATDDTSQNESFHTALPKGHKAIFQAILKGSGLSHSVLLFTPHSLTDQ